MLECTNKNSACAVPRGQWITAAHKQRRKFPWWNEAIYPCWSATGSLHFCKVFREISETGLVPSTTCNSATDKPALKTKSPTQFLSLLNHSALIYAASYWSPEPRHHTLEEWRIPKDKTIFLIFLQPCCQQYRVAPAHSYTAKEELSES